MSTDLQRRYRVTVALPRPPGDNALLPPDAQVLAEAPAPAVAAEDLMTAWTSARVLLSMTVEVPCEADALTAGRAVARALGDDTSVETEPVPEGRGS
jgi:hypothetical protein